MNPESPNPESAALLWRGIYRSGHEYVRLSNEQSQWRLEGVALFSYEQMPCRLDYQIVCDSDWHTTNCSVHGWVGDRSVSFEIRTDRNGEWWQNEIPCPAVTACLDIDLNFSPSTNLLPIRRLALAVGQSAEVKAAWLRFPSFELEPLEQVYQRLSDTIYRYSSASGAFVAQLVVNEMGLVTRYPDLWVAE
jgi:hypothetical protein